MSGQFLSPDNVQGNAVGMDPYSYVTGNPETFVDPTGHFIEGSGGDRIEGGQGDGSDSIQWGPESGDGEGSSADAIDSGGEEETASPAVHPDNGVSDNDPWANSGTDLNQEEQNWSEELHNKEWQREKQNQSHEVKNTPTDTTPTVDNSPTDNTPTVDNSPTDNTPTDTNDDNGDQGPGAYQQGNKGPSNYAPKQTSPGTQNINGVHVNNLGRVEPYNAQYDPYGRQIARTDYNASNDAEGIPDVHHHLTLYNDAYPNGIGLPPDLDHVPGEYSPLSWALFWLL